MTVQVRRTVRSTHVISRNLYWGVCFVLVFVAVSAFITLNYLRTEVYNRIASSTQNLAQSVEQTLDETINTIDIALLSVADEFQRQHATGSIDAESIENLLVRQKNRVEQVAFLRITDATGFVVYGVEKNKTSASLADREFFIHLRDTPDEKLYVNTVVFGRIAQKWIWTFARRMNDRNGKFLGVVYASMYVEDVEKILRKIHMEEGASIGIRDRDLGLIARVTFERLNPIATGSKKLSQPALLAMKTNPNKGTYTSDSTSIDPLTRVYSYNKSEKYKYLVNVGLALDRGFSAWRNQVFLVSVAFIVFATMLLVMARKMSLAWKRNDEIFAQLEDNANELSRKHNELLKTEREHREILGNLYTAIIVHAPDTSITFSNSRASEILGLSVEQLHGKVAIDPDWFFVNENGDRLDPEEYPVIRVLKSNTPINELVIGISSPNRNNLRWVLVSAFPEKNEQNELQQIIVNFHDITERKEAELRWQFALEGAGDGVWDLNLETKTAVYSQRYLDMLGYTNAEIGEKFEDWLSFVHSDDTAQLREVFSNYLNGSIPQFAIEYRMRCRNDSYKWVYARGMIVRKDRNGMPLRMVGTHTDISQMKMAEAKIWTEANYDSLTQLPNRRLFYDRIEECIKKAHRDGSHIALLFIDLDHFKEVNDTLGHHVGDRLLIEAAHRIKASVRSSDTVARLGGDEFTVILTNMSSTVDISQIAQKIIDQVSRPYLLGGVESYVSASIGISLYPDDASGVVDLTKNADQAMYSAKDAGRQCFRFFTKTMQEDAAHRIRLANDLRHALKGRQLEVYYQPIIALQSGSISKAEALLRWRHPEFGFISPATFIPIAEDNGTIHDIGDWVFQQAIAQAKLCEQATGSQFQISVNKSPVQFLAEKSAQGDWIRALEQNELTGDHIVIEITEGILINDDSRVSQSLLKFRDAGIQVAIDDFGTGYSSLSYLKKFDIDYIKIDQSFTRNLSPLSSDYALCEAIIVMAHKLGIKVIAEGVETEAQREILLEIGCDFGQGYLFSKPLPADQFMKFLLTT